MKTAISVPDPVFHAAESLASRLGVSRSRLYSTALAEYLSAHRTDGVTEQLDAICSSEASTLHPTLREAQLASLQPEDW